MVPPPRHLAFAITTRIKVMADLDIAERRMPQDGRIRLNVGGHPVDLRVSVLPTMFGESVVMRILDRSVVMLDLDAVGMDQRNSHLVPRGDSQAQRHRAGDRPDRLRENHHALRGTERTEFDRRQADHHRRSGGIRHRRRGADAHRRLDRQHIRPVLAFDSAPGSGQNPGGRNPRPGNGGNRRAGLADRAHGLQHAAHERFVPAR